MLNTEQNYLQQVRAGREVTKSTKDSLGQIFEALRAVVEKNPVKSKYLRPGNSFYFANLSELHLLIHYIILNRRRSSNFNSYFFFNQIWFRLKFASL